LPHGRHACGREKPIGTKCDDPSEKPFCSRKQERELSSFVEYTLQFCQGKFSAHSLLKIPQKSSPARKGRSPWDRTPPPPQSVGYSSAELDQSQNARFVGQQMRPLPDHLRQAVLAGGGSGELLPGLDAAGALLFADDSLVENGFSISGTARESFVL